MTALTDAYLDRLGLDREPPSAAALDRIHRRHVERVTYETTWIHLGEPWTIDPTDAAQRIATAGRGGYCFHLNGALSTLLTELGYDVTLHVGGVHRAAPDEADLHNHLVLLVHGLPTPGHSDGTWYVDAGLGDALHAPLPLRAGEFEQGPMTFRLEPTPGGVGDWHFTHDTSGSFAGMSFSTAPTDIAVFAARHEFLARSAESPFARTVTAQLRDADGTTVLRGRRVTRTDRTGSTGYVVDDLDAWIDVLAGTFHVDLSAASPAAIARMWDRARAATATTTRRRHRRPDRHRSAHPTRSSHMTRFVCSTCGTQYGDRTDPPDRCAICSDDRQYVGWSGQHWTTLEALQAAHSVRFEVDDGLLGVGITPAFGIPQRSLVLPTPAGNILWEATSLVTAAAVAELEAVGGISTIVISHPHFYASMVEWSEAFGGVPIVLHANDREWIARPSEHIELWDGDVLPLTDGVTLYRCPGHFPGSTVLHSTAGPNGRPILLAGDALHVAQDRRHVSFMYSVPNHVPSHPDDVEEIRRRLDTVDFDDLYGFTWGLNIIGGARACVDESFERYFRAVGRSPVRT